MSQDVKIEEALSAFMKEFGYDAVGRSYLRVDGSQLKDENGKGPLFSLRFVDTTPDHAMTSKPTVEVFATDMYPNEKGEIILYQWNWVGSAVGKMLTQRLRQRGYDARFTSRRGTKCVALVLPGL